MSFKSGHTSNVFQSKFLPHSGDTLIATTSRDGQVRLAGKNLKIRTNIFLKYSIGIGIYYFFLNLMYFKIELSVTGSCRSTRKVATHKGM